MFLIGLTGGIASGKSTICKILLELNVPVIDADVIARAGKMNDIFFVMTFLLLFYFFRYCKLRVKST